MAIFWNDGTELYHYGILGQKWGVRRYQNPDGTLTEEGKKRYQKQYEKSITRAISEVNAGSSSRHIRAYNLAANDMNNGGIDKFNAAWEKKHGRNYGDAYQDAYQAAFDKLSNKYLSDLTRDDINNNASYKKATQFADEMNRKYGKNTIKTLKINF